MLKVYGSEVCIDCRNYKLLQSLRGFRDEYIDITDNTVDLKEFLTLRDVEPVFEAVREKHSIGIPLFVREDGAMTLDMAEALEWMGEKPVTEEELAQFETACGVGGCK